MICIKCASTNQAPISSHCMQGHVFCVVSVTKYVCVKIVIAFLSGFEVPFVLGYSVRFVGDGAICLPLFSRSEMFKILPLNFDRPVR